MKEVTGEDIDMASLGGARVHERNGVAQLTAPGEPDAALLARELVGYLPQHREETTPAYPRRLRGTGHPIVTRPPSPARSTTCATSPPRLWTAAQ